jgi:aminomethyltransferase
MSALKRTPLYELHRRLGARMFEFGGFELPLQYSSIREEHAAVREAAGLFDVSHMGHFELEGSAAITAADPLVSRSVAALEPGRAIYALLCNDKGGVVDDVLCYRVAEQRAIWCVNASNIEKDWSWLRAHVPSSVNGIRDASAELGLLALQGPASASILERLSSAAVRALRRFRCARMDVAGCSTLVSRTGYTGVDGFELYARHGDLARIFEALLAEGSSFGVRPAGLGARDTLRLEAALPLYGHELDEDTSPLAAGLERFLDLDGHRFIGADAIASAREAGVAQRLVGFVLEERGVARAGCAVLDAGKPVGKVTSGAPSPTLGKSIGLAYVPADWAGAGRSIQVQVRDRALRARVVETPFV